jgi:hypothetical protein
LAESLIKHNESYINWTEIAQQEPTYTTVNFGVILKDLGAGLALVPIIAILEQIAIAKAFSMNTISLLLKKKKYFIFYYHANPCDTLFMLQAMEQKLIPHRK